MYMMFEHGTASINFRRCIPYDKDSLAYFVNKNLVAVITNIHNDSEVFLLQDRLYKISEEYKSILEATDNKAMVNRAFKRWGQTNMEKVATVIFQLPALLADYFDYGVADSLFFTEGELEYIESEFRVKSYRALCQIMYVDALGDFEFINMEDLYEVEKKTQRRPLIQEILGREPKTDDENVNLDLISFEAIASYMAQNDVYRLMDMNELHEHLKDKHAYNVERMRTKTEFDRVNAAVVMNEVLPYFTKYPGLEKVKTREVLERLYRSYAKQMHPDRNNGEGIELYQEFEDDFKLLRESMWIRAVETDFFEKHKLIQAKVVYPKVDLSWSEEELQTLRDEFVFAFTKMELEDMAERGDITSEELEYMLSVPTVTIEYDVVFDHGVSRRTLYLRQMRGEKNGV